MCTSRLLAVYLGVEAAHALRSVAPCFHLQGIARTCLSVPEKIHLAVSEFSEPMHHLCLLVSASGSFHDAVKVSESIQEAEITREAL